MASLASSLAGALPGRPGVDRAPGHDRPGHVPGHARARTRRRPGPLLRPAGHRRADRRDVGRAGRGAAAARRGARRARRDVPAEHPAGVRRGAGRLEVRRGDRAVQPDAARARAGEDPLRLGQPVPDLPGRPVRGRRAGGAAVDRRPAHHHDVAAPVSRSREAGAARARRLVAADAPRRGRSGRPGRAPRRARRRSRWSSPATTWRSWSTRRARRASRRRR